MRFSRLRKAVNCRFQDNPGFASRPPPAMTLNPEHDFIGLAPFLRLSIAGDDLRPVAQALLERAGRPRTPPACG